MIRVAFADDHQVVRSGLSAILSDAKDIELVGAAENGEQAISMAAEFEPDVMLLDLRMHETNGIIAAQRIHQRQPGIALIALTAFRDRDKVLASFDAGMVGYIVKDAPVADILRAIRDAAAGSSFLDSWAARTLIDTRGAAPTLTEREKEVLWLVACALTNRQISDRLGIAEKTVKAHLTKIYSALGVTDRTTAALWAREHLADRT